MPSLRQVRVGQLLTIQDLAQRAAVSPRTISRLETGRTIPRLCVVQRLATALGVKLQAVEEFRPVIAAAPALTSGGVVSQRAARAASVPQARPRWGEDRIGFIRKYAPARAHALVEQLQAGGATAIRGARDQEWVIAQVPSGALVQIIYLQAQGKYHVSRWRGPTAGSQILGTFREQAAAVACALHT